MRNHLDGAAQVVAAALLAQHVLVDPAGGEVVALGHARADETLVVAQVEVGLGAIFGDEYLAVLEGAHGARVHVMYGSSLSMVTLRPRASRIAASEADAMPLPREDTTPPVTKIYRVMENLSKRDR